MKHLFSVSAVLFTLLFAMFTISCNHSAEPQKTEQKEEKALYQCPMDCEKGTTYNHSGQCPVCEMDLEKVEKKSV